MANDNYDELVKAARIRARDMRRFHQDPDAGAVSDLADAVEQLQKERDELRPDAEAMRQIYHKAEDLGREFIAAAHFGLPQSFDAWLNAQLAHAEQRIADLQEALGYYEKAESVTFPAVNQGDPHGSCDCGHPENHAYASGYLMEFMATVDRRNVAKEALATDDEAAKK